MLVFSALPAVATLLGYVTVIQVDRQGFEGHWSHPCLTTHMLKPTNAKILSVNMPQSSFQGLPCDWNSFKKEMAQLQMKCSPGYCSFSTIKLKHKVLAICSLPIAHLCPVPLLRKKRGMVWSTFPTASHGSKWAATWRRQPCRPPSATIITQQHSWKWEGKSSVTVPLKKKTHKWHHF